MLGKSHRDPGSCKQGHETVNEKGQQKKNRHGAEGDVRWGGVGGPSADARSTTSRCCHSVWGPRFAKKHRNYSLSCNCATAAKVFECCDDSPKLYSTHCMAYCNSASPVPECTRQFLLCNAEAQTLTVIQFNFQIFDKQPIWLLDHSRVTKMQLTTMHNPLKFQPMHVPIKLIAKNYISLADSIHHL